MARRAKDTSQPGIARIDQICFHAKTEVSNSDQLFHPAWAIMMLETSTSSLSFRSSELSQLI